jgi:rfaE bifunctional protein nucleotidyltransferase chain/domain
MASKRYPYTQLARLGNALRRKRKRIVFTNGCFDVLHAGHAVYLQKAKRLGDFLVVGLNSDKSVRKLKGKGRPINKASDRVTVLSALSSVDAVVTFGEQTPLKLICALKPHVLAKGSDWNMRQIVGAPEVRSWGGSVQRIRFLKGRSTTKLISKARRARS